jgi:plasmid stability protein
MFERLTERAGRAAERRAAMKMRRMEAELRSVLPQGIGCEAGDKSVVIFGRGLLRRYVVDPSLRAMLGKLR